MKRKRASLLGVGPGQPSNRVTGGGQKSRLLTVAKLSLGSQRLEKGSRDAYRHTALNTSETISLSF